MSLDSLLHSEPDELLRKAASELRQHLETSQDGRVETVFHAFPSLASDPHRAVELIVLEFHFRRERGQNPDPSQWYERFPQWREQLRARLEPSPDDLDSRQRETALGTAPYVDASQRTLTDVDLDAPVLGKHEIVEEIGRGGMGVVYRARDRVLERTVALKVIRSGSLASAEEVRCFYREARSAAQLRHPNIVAIYGMGLHQGQHCFTMPLFPKGSLGQHLSEYRPDIRAAVSLAAKVARAVQAAHEYGLVHRDLKPGNILLDELGEPVVSDFGLARQLDATATQSLAEQPVGTPAYMAPEQARCEAATAASDIWALGVILYEMLTGRRPFTGGSEVVKQRILQADPLPPRRLRPDLPPDLETIVLKCLNKEPKRRYDSAAELADELERWLAGEPIRTRPESRWQRLRRRMAAKRVVRWSVPTWLAVTLLVLGLGGAGVWALIAIFSREAREQRRQGQVLETLQHELDEGRSVTLVGPVGPPKWYRWRTNGGRPPLPNLRKWPLKLESIQGRAMLELLPDPKQVAYRFSAELRPDNRTEMNIGLYFICEELATPTGAEQCFGLFRMTFAEKHMTEARLCLAGYIELDANEDSKWYEFPFSNVPPPPAPNLEQDPWRRIDVRVTPDTVRVLCDDCLMGTFSLPSQRTSISPIWHAAHKALVPPPTLPLRGGLGLYVDGGPAQFRNVVIEPLLEQ